FDFETERDRDVDIGAIGGELNTITEDVARRGTKQKEGEYCEVCGCHAPETFVLLWPEMLFVCERCLGVEPDDSIPSEGARIIPPIYVPAAYESLQTSRHYDHRELFRLAEAVERRKGMPNRKVCIVCPAPIKKGGNNHRPTCSGGHKEKYEKWLDDSVRAAKTKVFKGKIYLDRPNRRKGWAWGKWGSPESWRIEGAIKRDIIKVVSADVLNHIRESINKKKRRPLGTLRNFNGGGVVEVVEILEHRKEFYPITRCSPCLKGPIACGMPVRRRIREITGRPFCTETFWSIDNLKFHLEGYHRYKKRWVEDYPMYKMSWPEESPELVTHYIVSHNSHQVKLREAGGALLDGAGKEVGRAVDILETDTAPAKQKTVGNTPCGCVLYPDDENCSTEYYYHGDKEVGRSFDCNYNGTLLTTVVKVNGALYEVHLWRKESCFQAQYRTIRARGGTQEEALQNLKVRLHYT
ncbi:MAG: hypothetical protein NOU37_04215, partial [Candidatus Brocadiales bacterium]|nr:hypothetical protein [Candidatus Bathyanammoxibius amoris]